MPCKSGKHWPGRAQWSNPAFQKFIFSSHVPTGTLMKMKILSTLAWYFIVENPKSNFQYYKIIFLSCSLSCRENIRTLPQPYWFQPRFSRALESAHINQAARSKSVLERLRLSIMMEYDKWKTHWHFILHHTCNCQGSVTRHYQKVMWLFWKARLPDYVSPFWVVASKSPELLSETLFLLPA